MDDEGVDREIEVEHGAELLDEIVDAADDGERLGGVDAEEVDDAAGGGEILGVVEVGPDLLAQLLDVGAAPFEAGAIEQHGRVLVEAGGDRAADVGGVDVILGEERVEDDADLDLGGVAADLARALVDGVDGGAEVGLVAADADEDAVGDAAGHAEGAGAAGGDPDGHGAGVAKPRRLACTGLDLLAGEELLREDGGLLELDDPRGALAHEADGGVAGAKPEQRAAVGDGVDGRDRRGEDGGMAHDGVLDQRAERDRVGAPRSEGEHDVGVEREQGRGGDEREIPAELFALADVQREGGG